MLVVSFYDRPPIPSPAHNMFPCSSPLTITRGLRCASPSFEPLSTTLTGDACGRRYWFRPPKPCRRKTNEASRLSATGRTQFQDTPSSTTVIFTPRPMQTPLRRQALRLRRFRETAAQRRQQPRWQPPGRRLPQGLETVALLAVAASLLPDGLQPSRLLGATWVPVVSLTHPPRRQPPPRLLRARRHRRRSHSRTSAARRPSSTEWRTQLCWR